MKKVTVKQIEDFRQKQIDTIESISSGEVDPARKEIDHWTGIVAAHLDRVSSDLGNVADLATRLRSLRAAPTVEYLFLLREAIADLRARFPGEFNIPGVEDEVSVDGKIALLNAHTLIFDLAFSLIDFLKARNLFSMPEADA